MALGGGGRGANVLPWLPPRPSDRHPEGAATTGNPAWILGFRGKRTNLHEKYDYPEDPVVAATLGKNVLWVRVRAVTALLEGSRFLKDLIPILYDGQPAAVRLILIGLGLILLLIFLPNGIRREYRLQVRPEPDPPAAVPERR